MQFPLFEKIEVNGPNSHDLYKYLRINSELYDPKKNDVKEIPWNFAKFLVDEHGKVKKYYGPRTSPLDIKADIEKMI